MFLFGPRRTVSVNYNFVQRDKQKTTWEKSTAVVPFAVRTGLTPASSGATACVLRTAPLHHVLQSTPGSSHQRLPAKGRAWTQCVTARPAPHQKWWRCDADVQASYCLWNSWKMFVPTLFTVYHQLLPPPHTPPPPPPLTSATIVTLAKCSVRLQSIDHFFEGTAKALQTLWASRGNIWICYIQQLANTGRSSERERETKKKKHNCSSF